MITSPRIFLLVSFIALVACTNLMGQDVSYTVIAHSHNDYEQSVPLFRALENGFSSVEIDVFEHDGKIVVCHDEEDVADAPTLEELYLNPLFLSGPVSSPLILLIDLKEKDERLLEVLEKSLLPYQSYFQHIHTNKMDDKIQLILSGDVPKEKLLSSEEFPFFFVDGRVEDLKRQDPYSRIAMISGKFSDFTGWSGNSSPKFTEVQKLINTIKKVKDQNLPLRFWGTPDRPEVWDFLMEQEVEIIGVDDIQKFANFLSARKD